MMKLRLVLANIFRWRLRSTFTFLTVLSAFLLFGLLISLERVFNLGVELSNADRLIVTNKASVMSALPIKYLERIKAHENIEKVGHFTFFGGFYRDLDNKVSTIATEPKSYVDVIDDITFPNEQHKLDWFADRSSVAIGRDLADKYDWAVGDLIPIYSMFYPRQSGSRSWTFKVAAIFEPTDGESSTATIAVHYKYFDELRAGRKGIVDWYTIRMIDVSRTDETVAQLDAMFTNSPHETRTATEESFIQEFMNQIGDFTTIITFAMVAVFFTLLLVAGNTMAQSVNERISELAVLKTLGFKDATIFYLIIAEAMIMTFVGGYVGLGLSVFVIPELVELSGNLLSGMVFNPQDLIWGSICMFLVAIVSSIIPAIKAKQIKIVDGLEGTL